MVLCVVDVSVYSSKVLQLWNLHMLQMCMSFRVSRMGVLILHMHVNLVATPFPLPTTNYLDMSPIRLSHGFESGCEWVAFRNVLIGCDWEC